MTGAGTRRSHPARILMATAGLLLAVFVPYYLLTLDLSGPMPHDGTGLVVGRDFLNLWFYGRAAVTPDPGRYYDLPTYWRAVEAVAGNGYPGQQWSYPPTALLIAAPFGTLPYFPALILWTGIGVAAFIAALRLWTRDRWVIAAVALSPAAVFGMISGQFAYLAAAALLTALRWRERRPVLAGILLGLLTIKPQLGVLVPILLLAARSWRVIAVAALAAGLLVGATVLIWGAGVWSQYRLGLAHQTMVLTDPQLLAAPFMATAFMNVRSGGGPLWLAGAIQAIASIASAAVVWFAFRRQTPVENLRVNTAFLSASAVAMPYLMSYDTLALAAGAALLLERQAGPRALLLLAFVLPLLQMAAGSAGVPGPALVPIALPLWLARAEVPAGEPG